VPLEPRTHAVHALNHEFRPRTTPTVVAAVRCVVKVRRVVTEVNKRYYAAVKAVYDAEVRALEEFVTKRAYYEECLATFNKFMVNSRRQRALQKDIDQRKVRLEALRELRLQGMQAAKERQLALDKERATKQAAKEAAKKSTVTVVAQNAKKAVRAAQDKVRLLACGIVRLYVHFQPRAMLQFGTSNVEFYRRVLDPRPAVPKRCGHGRGGTEDGAQPP
jgi:hypothetical protein